MYICYILSKISNGNSASLTQISHLLLGHYIRLLEDLLRLEESERMTEFVEVRYMTGS